MNDIHVYWKDHLADIGWPASHPLQPDIPHLVGQTSYSGRKETNPRSFVVDTLVISIGGHAAKTKKQHSFFAPKKQVWKVWFGMNPAWTWSRWVCHFLMFLLFGILRVMSDDFFNIQPPSKEWQHQLIVKVFTRCPWICHIWWTTHNPPN